MPEDCVNDVHESDPGSKVKSYKGLTKSDKGVTGSDVKNSSLGRQVYVPKSVVQVPAMDDQFQQEPS